LFPVTETVNAFGFLFLHKLRIPAFLSPSSFMQQSHFEI
jgi:hypothetical protein